MGAVLRESLGYRELDVLDALVVTGRMSARDIEEDRGVDVKRVRDCLARLSARGFAWRRQVLTPRGAHRFGFVWRATQDGRRRWMKEIASGAVPGVPMCAR